MEREMEAAPEDAGAEAPPPGKTGAMLKLVMHYTLLAFAPVVAVIALVVAVIAINRHPDEGMQDAAATRSAELAAALADTRAEVESLKLILARERSVREEEYKQLEAHLQTASAPVAAPVPSGNLATPSAQPPTVHPTPAPVVKKPAPAAKAPARQEPAKKVTVRKESSKKEADKKPDKLKTLRESIEQQNGRK